VQAVVSRRAGDKPLLESDLKPSQLRRDANLGTVLQEGLGEAKRVWKYRENKIDLAHQMIIKGVSTATTRETESFLPK